jgi:hypothetical protein
MEGYLYDLPLNFYQHSVVTDGKFDPEKAAALGYSTAQFTVIEEFLGLDKVDTAPLPKIKAEE